MDRIGCCGICLGGGYALKFAAFDPRIKAVAGIACGYNSPALMQKAMGAEGYRAQLSMFLEIEQRQEATGEQEYWAAVDAEDGRPAVMGGEEPASYYLAPRAASPGWANQLTALSVRELITVDLAAVARHLTHAAADRARPQGRVHHPGAGLRGVRPGGRAEEAGVAGHQQPHRPVRRARIRGPGRGRGAGLVLHALRPA